MVKKGTGPSGAEKRKKRTFRDEAAARGARTLFQFGNVVQVAVDLPRDPHPVPVPAPVPVPQPAPALQPAPAPQPAPALQPAPAPTISTVSFTSAAGKP